MKQNYSIKIQYVYHEEDGYGYWIAWHPEFGQATCSFADDTPEEALKGLFKVKEMIIEYFKENNKELPKPKIES